MESEKPVIKIWLFPTHYMYRCKIGKYSYGYRVNTNFLLDEEYGDRVDRLVEKVKRIKESVENEVCKG